jgi:hypothetical protein
VECSKIGNKVARDVSGKHKEADFYFVCEWDLYLHYFISKVG